MRQRVFYESIKNWLESKGFRVLITGDKTELVITVRDLVPVAYKIPDLIGVDKSRKVIIVEVEQNKKKFFEVLGRCMLWKCMATFVYIAFPEEEFQKAKALEQLGVGLLIVNENSNEVKEPITMLLKRNNDIFKTLELHPLDPRKEEQLAMQIENVIENNR